MRAPSQPLLPEHYCFCLLSCPHVYLHSSLPPSPFCPALLCNLIHLAMAPDQYPFSFALERASWFGQFQTAFAWGASRSPQGSAAKYRCCTNKYIRKASTGSSQPPLHLPWECSSTCRGRRRGHFWALLHCGTDTLIYAHACAVSTWMTSIEIDLWLIWLIGFSSVQREGNNWFIFSWIGYRQFADDESIGELPPS